MPIAGAFVVPHPPLLFPEIGHGEQFRIQKTIDAYHEAARRVAGMRPDTLVIISPHARMYQDGFHLSAGAGATGDFSRFGCSQVKLSAVYDEELTARIESLANRKGIPAVAEPIDSWETSDSWEAADSWEPALSQKALLQKTLPREAGAKSLPLDHGTMIPLRFVQEACTEELPVVRVGLSGLSFSAHYRLGECIREAAEELGRRVVILASGDLSHRLLDSGPYGYAKEGPEYDRKITEVLGAGALEETLSFSEDLCEKAGECGHRSITILAGCLKGIPLKAELLSYEGPFGVGYAVAAFQDAYVALAKRSLAYSVRKQGVMERPDGLPEELLRKRAGAFVSLKKRGNLRGCIGTIEAVRECVAEEVIENAVSAGLWDPRFPQVEERELAELICTVDILSEPELITSPQQLDVKKYGVIVSCGGKRGLLLPNLEGVDSIEEQVDIARRKAGIDRAAFEQGLCRLERFEVVRHY